MSEEREPIDKQSIIPSEELRLLRAVASRSMDLVKAREWKELLRCLRWY